MMFLDLFHDYQSTSLAKICYYLLARGLKVAMAACDTFRAGAVEQLKTHAKRLGVEVFDQGYNKDASSVAAEGIRQATRKGCDVLLIDTAGRMPDNLALMRALSNLVVRNNPDLVRKRRPSFLIFLDPFCRRSSCWK
jgi:signal recognition particle receptor subunit alpha